MLLIYNLFMIETKINDEYNKADLMILMGRRYNSFMSYLPSGAWVTYKRDFFAKIVDFYRTEEFILSTRNLILF